MVNNNDRSSMKMDRRSIIKTVGAGTFAGVTLGGIAGNAAASEKEQGFTPLSQSNPEWSETVVSNTGNNFDNIEMSSTLGYYKSQLITVWNGEQVDRWQHLFDSSTIGSVDNGPDGYTWFGDQAFTARTPPNPPCSCSPIEIHGYPEAGTTSTPFSSGNWSGVALTVIESALTEISKKINVAATAYDIYSSYTNESFDSRTKSKIHLKKDYFTTKQLVSNSVNFTASSKPNEFTALEVYTEADAFYVKMNIVLGDNSASYYFSESGDTQIRETLDQMGPEELDNLGITRVDPTEFSDSQRRQSRFDLSSDKPTYLKKFPVEVESVEAGINEDKLNQSRGRRGRRHSG